MVLLLLLELVILVALLLLLLLLMLVLLLLLLLLLLMLMLSPYYSPDPIYLAWPLQEKPVSLHPRHIWHVVVDVDHNILSDDLQLYVQGLKSKRNGPVSHALIFYVQL